MDACDHLLSLFFVTCIVFEIAANHNITKTINIIVFKLILQSVIYSLIFNFFNCDRTQARLQKLVDEFPLVETSIPVNHGEESDVNVVSDGEPNHAIHMELESDRNHAPTGIEKEDIDVEVISRADNGKSEE